MDLSSIGIKTILVLITCAVSFGQIYIEESDDTSFQHDNYYETEERGFHVSGDVFIVDKLSSGSQDALQVLFENVLETSDEVFVKIAGNSISIITDFGELTDVLKNANNQKDGRYNIVNDILEVLQVAPRITHFYIVTGQGCGGTELTEDLTTQIKRRDVRIDILHLQDDYDNGFRLKRQINFYQLLANISGGSVINTNKQNIGSALDLLKQSIKTSLIHIMRFSDHSPAGKKFRIPVDDTMTQFIFRAQVERSNPVIIATNPAGIPPPAHPRLLGKASAGTVVGLLETNLTKPTDYGTWDIIKMDFNLWDIQVDGQSPIDFTHEFLEPGSGGFGEFPIKGRPIIGNTYKLSINVPEYAKVQNVSMGMLFTRETLMPIVMRPLKNVGGRRGKSMFYEHFTIPSKDFMVGIEGRDKSGHMFRRIDPVMITPVGLKLVIPSLTGVRFYQNETLAIPFTVINQGSKEQDVDVKIEDDKKFAQPPSILSSTIKPGQNFSGTFTIKAGLTVGETTTVTITAKPYLGHGLFSQGQFEIRRFTVLDKNITTTTLSTPTTSTTTTSSTSTATTPTTTTNATTPKTTTTTSSKSSTPTTSSTGSVSLSTVKGPSITPMSTASGKSASTGSTKSPTSIISSSKAHSSAATSSKLTGSFSTFISTISLSSTVPPVSPSKSPSKAPASSTTAKAGQTSTNTMTTTVKSTKSSASTTKAPENNNESKNTDLPATSVVVGVTTGAIVGIAAVGTMALLFRQAMTKALKAVGPNTDEAERRRRQNNLAWT